MLSIRCGQLPSRSKAVDPTAWLAKHGELPFVSRGEDPYATVRPSIRMRASNLTNSVCYAIDTSKLANIGSAPAVDGNMEGRASLQAGDEAGHDGHTAGPMVVGELAVGDNLAHDLELFQGHFGFAARGEEENVPVFVTHGCWRRMMKSVERRKGLFSSYSPADEDRGGSASG